MLSCIGEIVKTITEDNFHIICKHTCFIDTHTHSLDFLRRPVWEHPTTSLADRFAFQRETCEDINQLNLNHHHPSAAVHNVLRSCRRTFLVQWHRKRKSWADEMSLRFFNECNNLYIKVHLVSSWVRLPTSGACSVIPKEIIVRITIKWLQ